MSKSAHSDVGTIVWFLATDKGRGNPGSSSEIEQSHFAEGSHEKTQPHAQGQGSQRVLHQQSPGVPVGASAPRGLLVSFALVLQFA